MAEESSAATAGAPIPSASRTAAKPSQQAPRWCRLLRDPGRWLYPAGLVALTVLLFSAQLRRGEITTPLDALGVSYPWNQQPEYAALVKDGLQNPIENDAADSQVPWYLFTRRELHHFRFPFWSPNTQGGTPFFAMNLPAVLYPITLISLGMPLMLALQFLVMITPVIAGLGMYAYLRLIWLRRPAAFMGSAAFMFSSLFITWINHTQAPVASWFPWTILCIEAIIQGRRHITWWSGALAGFTAIQLLGGHVETSAHVLLFDGLYTVVRVILLGCSARNPKCIRHSARIICISAVSLLVGITIAAVQLIPTAHYVLGSYEQTVRESRPVAHLAISEIAFWAVPFLRGNPAYYAFGLSGQPEFNYSVIVGYCGITTLSIAVYTLFLKASKLSQHIWTLMVLVVVATSLAYNIEPISLLNNLPIFRVIVSAWMDFIISFSMAGIAAIGLHTLLEPEVHSRNNRRIIGISPNRLLEVSSVCAAGAVFAAGALMSKIDILAAIKLLGRGGTPVDFDLWREAWVLAAAALVVFCVCLVRLRLGGRLGGTSFAAAIILLVLGDMFIFAGRFQPSIGRKLLYPPAPVIDAIHYFGPEARVAMPSAPVHPGYIYPYGLRNVSSSPDYAFLSRPRKLLHAINRLGPEASSEFTQATNLTPDRHLLAVVDVSLFLVQSGDMEPPGTGTHLEAQQQGLGDQPAVALAPGDEVDEDVAATSTQLSAVALLVEADGLQPGPPLTVRLLDQDSGAVLATSAAPVAASSAGSWLLAAFPTVEVQPGQRLRVAVARPSGDASGRGIRLFSTAQPLMQGAQFLHNGRPAAGALSLRMYEPAAADTLTPVWHDNVTTLYRVEGARPRVYVADGVIATQGDAATLAALDQLHVPGADAVIESRAPIASNGGQATIVRDLAGDITVKVTMTAPGVLVLNEGYGDGGWQVTVDGRSTRDLRANYIYQGAQVQAGEHTVHFRYRPPTWTASVTISLIGVVIVLVLFAWPLIQRVRHRRARIGPIERA